MIIPKINASATLLVGWDLSGVRYAGSNSSCTINYPSAGCLSDGSYSKANCVRFNLSDGDTVTAAITYDHDYSFSDPNYVSFYLAKSTYADEVVVDVFMPDNGPVFRYTGDCTTNNYPSSSSDYTLCATERIIESGVNSNDFILIQLTCESNVTVTWYMPELILDVNPAPPPMPNLDGYIYDLEIDGTNFTDCRNYVNALFENFIANDFYQAIYLPYYTISKWYVSQAYYYWTIILSEEPIISTANADSYLTVSNGTFMIYSGLASEDGYDTTLYYNGYYAPGSDPVLLYEKGLNEWVGINGDVSSELMSGADVYQYQLDGEYRRQNYEIVTNYLIDNNTGVQPSSGLIYTNSTIPQGWFTLYNNWRAAGNDASGDVLLQILAKVTHIDNDIHDIFLDTDEYQDEATAAVDDLINDGAGAASTAISGTGDAVGTILGSSETILGAVTDVTSALGDEWTMLVALAGFGLVALILQRRTG